MEIFSNGVYPMSPVLRFAHRLSPFRSNRYVGQSNTLFNVFNSLRRMSTPLKCGGNSRFTFFWNFISSLLGLKLFRPFLSALGICSLCLSMLRLFQSLELSPHFFNGLGRLLYASLPVTDCFALRVAFYLPRSSLATICSVLKAPSTQINPSMQIDKKHFNLKGVVLKKVFSYKYKLLRIFGVGEFSSPLKGSIPFAFSNIIRRSRFSIFRIFRSNIRVNVVNFGFHDASIIPVREG